MSFTLSPFDRGFLYGDAVFTTVRIYRGRPLLWPLHLRRLRQDCARLAIPYPGDGEIERQVFPLLGNQNDAVLRIEISRGLGPRGYRLPKHPKPTLIVSLFPFKAPERLIEGIAVRWCETRLSIQPRLAGIKHCNRLEQILARSEWDTPEIFEGLMCDGDGYVVSGTMTNLFWIERGKAWTPKLDRCGVEGVMRRFLMAGGGIREGRFLPPRLLRAEALFLTNAVLGVVPVRVLLERGRKYHFNVEAVEPWRAEWERLFA